MTAPSSNEYEPGMEVVPGYTLISRLGSGMAGDVWVAQAAGGIKVAIKIVRSLSVLGGRKELKALKTVRGVHHPNLCPLFGFWTKDADGRFLEDGETEELTFDSLGDEPIAGESAGDTDSQSLMGTMALGQHQPPAPPSPEPDKSKPKVTAEQLIVVMGLGDCTLFDRLRYVRQEAGIAPDDESTCYGIDAAEAIRYLKASASAIDLLNREHQIYHCDIKPQNILLVGGEAQVCDFGLAKRIEGDMRQTQQAFATPAYAPPEVLHNEGYSRWVDQYSLAVTYYELRTGLLPFDITTHANMLVAKATGKLDLTALLPSERKVMQKALNRIPEQRYGSCTEFISALAVASGVEKGGGITAKKLIAGVAAMVFVVLLGMGGWWQLAPDNFFAFWSNKEARVEDRLEDVRTELSATELKGFQASYNTLDLVLDKTAEIAQDPGSEESRDNALSLFATAANRLVRKAHIALDSPTVDDELFEQIRNEFRQFEEDDLIRETITRWSTSKTGSLQKQYTSFDSTLCSGQMRLAFRSQTTETESKIDALRVFVDASPRSFDSSNGGFARAALLPLFVALNGEELKAIDGARWLSLPLVDDVLRAQSVAVDSVPEDYRERWLEIRSVFTTVSSAYLSGPNDVASDIRERVREAFPKLHVDSMMVRLRGAAESGRWGEIDSIRAEIPPANLSPGDRQFLDVIEAFSAYRGQRDEFVKVVQNLRKINGSFEELRLGASLNAYLAQFADQQWESALAMQPVATLPLEEVEWVQTQLSVSLPEKLFAARLVEGLTSPAISLGVDEADAYTSRLESQDWVVLQAAMRLDSALRSPIDDGNASAQSLRADEKLLAQSDDVGVWRVPDWLHHSLSCGSAAAQVIRGGRVSREELARLLELQKLVPPEGLKRVGLERASGLVELCVQAAIAASGVGDSDFVAQRYWEASGENAAGSFLELGKQWEQVYDGSSKSLAEEQFLFALAQPDGAGTGELRLPPTLEQDIQTGDLSNHSIPLLRGILKLGLDRLESQSNRMEWINRRILRTALAILDHPDAPVFGQEGQKGDKQTIRQAVLIPTIRLVLENSEPGSFGELDRRLAAEIDVLAAKRICQVFADASQDQTVSGLLVSAQANREVAQAAAIGATDRNAKPVDRQRWWLIAGFRGLDIPKFRGKDVHFASTQAQRITPLRPDVAVLEALARQRQAEQITEEDDPEKPRLMQQAVASLEAELGRMGPGNANQGAVFYTLHSISAALYVKIAYLNSDKGIKQRLLKKALLHVGEAAKHQDNAILSDEYLFPGEPANAVHLSEGNAKEDLAHYCGLENEERQTYFGESAAAFRTAITKTKNSTKARYSLARCLYRQSRSLGGDARLLDEAIEGCGKEPNAQGANLDDVGEWYFWRTTIELSLRNSKNARKFGSQGLKFADDERCNSKLRGALAYLYAYTLVANPIKPDDRDTAVRVLFKYLAISNVKQQADNLTLITKIVLGGGHDERLIEIAESLAQQKEILAEESSDKGKLFLTIAALCTQEILKGTDATVKDPRGLRRVVVAATSRVKGSGGSGLADRLQSFGSSSNLTPQQRAKFAVVLGSYVLDDDYEKLAKVLSKCEVLVLFPLAKSMPASEFAALFQAGETNGLIESLRVAEQFFPDLSNVISKIRKLIKPDSESQE